MSVSETYNILSLINIMYCVQGDLIADPNITLEVMILNDTVDEGETLQEEWVSEAILDVAYYLRSHKFNEFDRRFQDESNAERIFYKSFPNPPLRSLHWEVHKNCITGFLECLKYLTLHINSSPIRRSADTVHKAYEKGWKLPDDSKAVEAADEECQRRIKMEDKEIEDLYGGPIQRFQWKTTAAYYMCYFTMERLPDLSLFAEPCDNFANCSWEGKLNNQDPRADDSKPFYCAMYSFCPDVCCPLKHVKDINECINSDENPCISETSNGLNKECKLYQERNAEFYSLVRNRWNATCHCEEEGFAWDSRFGMCVDIDECLDNTDGCDEVTEACLNLRGSYACACAVGYRWNTTIEKCTPIVAFQQLENISVALLMSEAVVPEKENLKTKLKGVFWKIKERPEGNNEEP